MWLLISWGCGGGAVDGPVPAGVWGEGSDGDGILLTVAEDASAHLDNGCWGGDIDQLVAVDGAFDVTFGYDLRVDTGGAVPSELRGTVDGDTIEAVLAIDGGDPQDHTLVLGHEIELYECP